MVALFAPAIAVNDVPIAIKPNSFKYKDGFGTRNVRVASGGGSNTQSVISEDIESQKGMCQFILYSTAENVKLVRQWLFNAENNTVSSTDKGGFNRTFQKAIITNDVEIALGQDAEFQVEFESQRSV